MDFEDSLKGKKSGKTPNSSLSSTKKFLELDWRAKVKLAVPLTIYFLILAVVFKLLYSVIFESIFEEDENGEVVCY